MHELRKDILIGRWVVVMTDHSKDPSYYFTDRRKPAPRIEPCPLCLQGNGLGTKEILAVKNPDDPNASVAVRVLANKDPLLQVDGDLSRRGVGMYDAMNGIGANEVIVESVEHNIEPEEIGNGHMAVLLDTYRQRLADLQKDTRFRYLLLFKNHGRAAGSAYDHPHSQIVATPITPKTVREELNGARTYFKFKERCIFCDILSQEMKTGTRIVAENIDFLAFVPFAPRSPFEIWILPRRHQHNYTDLKPEQTGNLASILTACLMKLKLILKDPPYNLVLHNSPNKLPRVDHWQTLEDDFHWHIELIPRLFRMDGFEWGSGLHILPTTPEDAAGFLRRA